MKNDNKELRSTLKEKLIKLQKLYRAGSHREISVGTKKISVPTHIGTLHFIVETNPMLNIGLIEMNYPGKWDDRKEFEENLYVRKILSALTKSYLEPLAKANKWKGYVLNYQTGLFYQLDNFFVKEADQDEKRFVQYVLWNAKEFKLVRKTKLLDTYIELVKRKVDEIKELGQQLPLLDLPSDEERITNILRSGHRFMFCGNKMEIKFFPVSNHIILKKDNVEKHISFVAEAIIEEFDKIKLESQAVITVDEPKENFIKFATYLYTGWTTYTSITEEKKEQILSLYKHMSGIIQDWYLLEEISLKFYKRIQQKEPVVSLQKKDAALSLDVYRVVVQDHFCFLTVITDNDKTKVESFCSNDEKDNRINELIIKYLGI